MTKQHDNGMEALAEAFCTPEEVESLVRPLMENALRRAKKTHSTVREARLGMKRAADKFLNAHFYELPRREAHFVQWTKRYLKGYQRWWRRVESARVQIVARNRKNGTMNGPGNINARAEAIQRVSPELYECPVLDTCGS